MPGDPLIGEHRSRREIAAKRLKDVQEFLCGSMVDNSGYDFSSAHFNYDVMSDLPDEALLAPTFQEVVSKILVKETKLDFKEDQIIPFHMKTRLVIDRLFRIFAGREKVALPLPNWHFWDMRCEQGSYGFRYFQGENEDQLVGNFSTVAKEGDVKCLVLVSPANPLMYKLSEDAAKEIDGIALKHNIEVIINDILRGVQPVGDRRSIGEYFTRPYIVEGFSKRFGEYPLGNKAYVLVPEDDLVVRGEHAKEERLCGGILELAYRYSTEHISEELRARNSAFDSGIYVHNPNIVILRPSDTHLISLLILPDGFQTQNLRSNLSGHIDIRYKSDYYPGGYEKNPDFLRITTATMDTDQIYDGAMELGNAIISANREII